MRIIVNNSQPQGPPRINNNNNNNAAPQQSQANLPVGVTEQPSSVLRRRVPDPDTEEEKREIEERMLLMNRANTNMESCTYINNSNNQNSINNNNNIRNIRPRKRLNDNTSMEEGYNSSDERSHGSHPVYSRPLSKDEIIHILQTRSEDMHRFEEELKRNKGLVIKRMGEDGNCLFRSVADQVFGDEEMHDQVRERCMNYMKAERDHFSQFVTEDFEEYIARKRQDRCFGNNLEIQAMGELFNRPIEIYTFQEGQMLMEPINIFHDQYSTDSPPIRLSYHNGNHYNSVVDPNNPSIGVGLGLPGLVPGLADKMQMKDALLESESHEIEKELFNKLKAESEIEQTDQEIEEAILAQSQWEIEQEIIAASRKEYYESQLRQFQENQKKT